MKRVNIPGTHSLQARRIAPLPWSWLEGEDLVVKLDKTMRYLPLPDAERSLGRLPKVLEIGCHRRRRINDQNNIHGHLPQTQITQRLLSSIFEDAKVFAGEITNKRARAITNSNRQQYLRSVDGDHVVGIDFLFILFWRRSWRRWFRLRGHGEREQGA